MTSGLLQHFVDAGWVVADAFGFSLQPLGALQLRGGGHIRFQGHGEAFARLEALQQFLEATAELRLAQGFDGFLRQGITPDAVHQGFQRIGANAKRTQLLHEHGAGHLAFAEAGEVHAAAQPINRFVVAGLTPLGGNGDLHSQAAAGTGGGGDLQAGGTH